MWQVFTIAILLALMIGLEVFNLVPLEQYLGAAPPFTPKSLAATGFIILAAFTTGALFQRFKLPALLGYIAAGIIFGPQFIQIAYEFGVQHFPDVLHTLFHGHPPRALFSAQVIADLELINILTIGVIGTMGGGELKLEDIKESWKLILLTISLIVVTAIPLTIAVVMGLTYSELGLTPFLDDVSTSSKIGAALLFGILAVAMSPAATLAILQETRAQGKFTSLALGIVVVADLVLVALFLVGINISKLLVAPDGFNLGKLAEAMPGIGMEFAWALVVGGVTGALFIAYMRYVRREMMLFTVAIIFAAAYACKILHAETLLAFLTAGFIVQNFSRHGHDLIHELEKLSTPVFIIYFMTQAALLDIKGVVAYLPLTLILALLRGASFYGSVRFATRKLQSDDVTQRWLWASFLSRGGVDLVLAAMVAGAMTAGAPTFVWGTDFQTVVMATVVVHIIVGPPILKIALGRAGETQEARENQGSEVAENGLDFTPNLDEVEFPTPSFRDRVLNERLYQMRAHLIALHEKLIAEPLNDRRKRLEESVSHVHSDIDDSLKKLEEILQSERYENPADLRRSIVALHAQSRRKLQQSIQLWEHLEPLVFRTESAGQLILEIQRFEQFDNQYVVETEPELYDPDGDDRRWVKLVRKLRSLQRTLTGTGRRNIPLGRLWRYYIELSIPRYLARAATETAEPHEAFWFELGRYLRRFDALFDELLEILDTPAATAEPEPAPVEEQVEGGVEEALSSDEEHISEAHDEEHDEHGDEEDHDQYALHHPLQSLNELDEPRERAIVFVHLARDLHSENAAHVIKSLNTWLIAATQGYSWSLQQVYETFLDAVARAGTLELPSLMYRPSTQFDDARRAELQLSKRLANEEDIVSAYVGWIVLDHQLALFSNWFGHYQTRITDTLHNLFKEQSLKQLERMEKLCELAIEEAEQDPEAETRWDDWLERELAPLARSTRRTLDRALISFGQGVASRRLIDALEYRVASFSESLHLLLQDPHETAPSQAGLETLDLQVRRWFTNRLISEIALRYIEFNERTERIVRRNLVGLDSIHQVIEYNLSKEPGESSDSPTADEELPEIDALGALRRAKRMIEQQRQNLAQDVLELQQWIVEETDGVCARATGPFMEHRISDLPRQLLRRETSTASSKQGVLAMVDPALTWIRGTYASLTPLYEELREDIQHILNDAPHTTKRSDVREYLEVEAPATLKQLPPIYRRLFNPVPLDLPEFFVDRPELEAQCLSAIAQWGRNQPVSILIHGDRGIGKRTFIHSLVPTKIYDLAPVFQKTPIQTIRLGEEIHTEEQLCAPFTPLFDGEPKRSFSDMARAIHNLPHREIVVIENANKCYQRTSEGLTLCRNFLELLSQTSAQVLWVLLMDTPATTLLDTMIDIFDYFSHSFELEAFSEEQLEHMILNRHRVSGFEVDYESPQVRLLYRARHPLAASESLRNPHRDYFRRLHATSRGNPLMALLYWLRSIQPDLSDDTQLHVMPLTSKPIHVLQGLTLEKRLILALLLQHGSLPPHMLCEILLVSPEEIETQLAHLQRLGFVEVIGGTSRYFRIRDLASVEVTFELRHANLV